MPAVEPEKATIKATEGKLSGKTVTAQFNPKELTISKAVNWNKHPTTGTDRGYVQFNSGEPRMLTVALFFNGFEDKKSVRPTCETLIQLAEKDGDLHRPPEVEFHWKDEKFTGVVNNVSVTYQMFLKNGDPCRATVTVSMQNYSPKDRTEKSPNQSPDFAKLHTLRRGETLHHLAAKEYNDAAEWRRIADANGIDDPLAVEPGTKLLLPPIL